MFSTLKGYLAAGAAAVILVFAAIFKYRGNKIENLETELEVAETTAKVASKVAKNEVEVATYEAANEEAAENAKERNYEEINKHFYSI